eukprot:766421-Hanusia_phi.AAC.8
MAGIAKLAFVIALLMHAATRSSSSSSKFSDPLSVHVEQERGVVIISPAHGESYHVGESVMLSFGFEGGDSRVFSYVVRFDGVVIQSGEALDESIVNMALEELTCGWHEASVSLVQHPDIAESLPDDGMSRMNTHATSAFNVSCTDTGSSHLAEAARQRAEPLVRIVEPQVNHVYRYDSHEGGAVAEIFVQVLNFPMGPEQGSVVLSLNEVEFHRGTQSRIKMSIGGLSVGTFVLSVSLFDAQGNLVRGRSPTKRHYEQDTDAADCYAPFKVDRQVWEGVERDSEALYEGRYRSRLFPSPQNNDSLQFCANVADNSISINLDRVYVFEDLVEAYREFHNRALCSKPGSVPLYVYTPRDCGWGNRLIDLASAYMISVSMSSNTPRYLTWPVDFD